LIWISAGPDSREHAEQPEDAVSGAAITNRYHLRMKLNALQALVAAIDEGSLRAAARRIGVTQPALTKMVRELERELGAPLLERSTTGVTPTAQGRILHARAKAATLELDEAVQQITQMGGRMVGQLAVGAVPLALLLLVPEAVRTFSREFPAMMLQLREELYIGQVELLRQRQVDLVVGPIPDNLPPGECHVEPLMPIEMAVVVGPGHPKARARSLAELQDARWVYTSLSGQSGYAKWLFERHGLTPPAPAAIVNSTLGLISLISRGDCVGLMPLPIATHATAAPFMRVLRLREGTLPLTLGAMALSAVAVRPAVRHFITHLHRAAAQLARGARPVA
jgi:LysR family transcriptional regulator, regulator of abg operon